MKLVYWVLLLSAVIIFGSNFTTVRFGLRYSQPIAFSMLRALLGGLITVPFAWYTIRGIKSKNATRTASPLLLPRDVKTFAVIALFGFMTSTCFFGFWYVGETLVSASVSSVLVNTSPFFTLVLAFVFLNGKIFRTQAPGLILGFFGTFLVATNGALNGFAGDWRGFIFLLLSAFSSAAGLIIYKKYLTKFEGFTINAIQLFFAAIGLFLWALITEPNAFSQIDYANQTFIAALLYSTIFGSVVANLIWMAIVRQRGPEWFSMWLFLNPVFGVLISSLVLQESLLPFQFVGMGLVAFSIFMINREFAKRAQIALHAQAR
jgi:O-acetylserine/cysteine efflux transporter